MLAELDVDLTLTTNASLLPREGAGARRRRARPHHRQPRLARRRDVPRDERRRLPGRPRARGDRGGARGRAAGQGELRRQARRQRRPDRRRWRATSAAPATRSASSSSWTSARRTAGAWTTSSPPPRSSPRSTPSSRSSRPTPHYRGEVAKRWRYVDGARRDRRHRLGHAAVLRRLHPRRASRPRASSTPASSRCAATTCARSIRGGASDEELAARARRDLAASAATATRSSAPRRRPRRRAAVEMSLHRRLSRALRHDTGPLAPVRRVLPCSATSGLRDKVLTGCRRVVAAGRRYLPRGWGDLGPPARRSGSASSARTSSRAASPTAIPTRRSRTASGSSTSRANAHAPALRADVPAVRRAAALARAARLVDVLELRVHRPRAGAALGLPPAPRLFARFRNTILLANVIGLLGYSFDADGAAAAARRSASSNEPQRRPRPARREPLRGDAEPARRDSLIVGVVLAGVVAALVGEGVLGRSGRPGSGSP